MKLTAISSFSLAAIKERAEISATLRIYEDENISKEFRSEPFTSVKDIIGGLIV